jgi:DNA-binding response OmpR family regulator
MSELFHGHTSSANRVACATAGQNEGAGLLIGPFSDLRSKRKREIGEAERTLTGHASRAVRLTRERTHKTGSGHAGVDKKTFIGTSALGGDVERGGERRRARVLLIEADSRIRSLVGAGLARDGLAVATVAEGAAAVEALRSERVDLVLLDLALLDMDGFALLAAIRTARPRLPVIVLTADEDERSRVAAFAGGADDCISGPFSLVELAARVDARLRRREDSGTLLEVGPLKLDLAGHRASLDGRWVSLSAREASLLAAFARHAGEVLSRDELLRQVWQLAFDPGSNVVEVYVAALRRKLGAQIIETVRGRGYRLRVSTRAAVTSNA